MRNPQHPRHGFGFPRGQRDPGENLFYQVCGTPVEDLVNEIREVTSYCCPSRFFSEIEIGPSLIFLPDVSFVLQLLQHRQHRGLGAWPSVRKLVPHIVDGSPGAGPQDGEHLKFEVRWMRDLHVRKNLRQVPQQAGQPSANCYYHSSNRVNKIFITS